MVKKVITCPRVVVFIEERVRKLGKISLSSVKYTILVQNDS